MKEESLYDDTNFYIIIDKECDEKNQISKDKYDKLKKN